MIDTGPEKPAVQENTPVLKDEQEPAIQRRSIRSFVKRAGRITTAQKAALKECWPQYGLEYEQGSVLDFAQLFPGLEKIKLEIGFGNGDALVQMAAQDPHSAYLGIEVHEPGVGHCLHQLQQGQLNNVRLIAHDAVEVLEHMIPAGSLDRVFLFFPDPWHKKRHHKRRIVNAYFRELLVKCLKPGADLHMATDWQDYAEVMAEEMLADARFENLGDAEGYSAKPGYRPETRFERRGQRLGHGVWDLLFRKKLG